MTSERRPPPSSARAALEIDRRGVLVRRATVAEILPLRHAELRPGLPREAAIFDGDDDATTRHFAAFLVQREDAPSAEVVGCASFMIAPHAGTRAFQLRGMATRADLVRRGVGTSVLRHALAEITSGDGVRLFWCNARVGAVPFYVRMGWRIASDVFEIPTAGPHQVMTCAPENTGGAGNGEWA